MRFNVCSLIVLCLLASCGSQQQAPDSEQAENILIPTSKVILTHPGELAHEFLQNRPAADKKYRGQTVSLTGNIVHLVRSGGFTDATLEWPSAKGRIEISLAADEPDADLLTVGQPISIACSVIDSFEQPIMLRQCEGLMILDRN